MRLLVVAALAACVAASCARAQTTTTAISQGQPPTQMLPTCSLSIVNGAPVYTSCPVGVGQADPNNVAFHGARVLTPSGTAGTAGLINSAPYPVTTGTSAVATAATDGYSFSWVCTGAGLGSITLTDGSVLPYYFSAGSGGIQRDAYAIIDAEPGAASGCTFGVLR